MSKASILIVDDEPAVLKVLVTRLQLAGYQVHQATNGEEALEAFHRESPDLIVLDVMLPKIKREGQINNLYRWIIDSKK